MPTANHALRICVWQKSASIDVMPWGLALDVIGRTSVGGGCTCLGTCSVNSFPRGTLAAVAFALPTLTVFDPLRTLARLRVRTTFAGSNALLALELQSFLRRTQFVHGPSRLAASQPIRAFLHPSQLVYCLRPVVSIAE